jgi:hypothetical protein
MSNPRYGQHLDGERRYSDMAFQRVITNHLEGRRVYLTLACGHLKLHNSRAVVPYKAHCPECCKGPK